MRIRLTRHAVRDLEKACEHYATISPDLHERFLAGFDAVLERLEMFPHGAPPVEGFDGIRRARMRRFPYGLFYQYSAGPDLLILRVLHDRRDRSSALQEPGP